MGLFNILVVDDEQIPRDLVSEFLETMDNVKVTQEEDSLNVINRIKTEDVNLLITDEVMPGKKGSDIIKIMSEDEELKDIPVILMSGVMKSLEKGSIISLGMNLRFIEKPFTMDKIQEKVSILIESHFRNKTS